VKLIVGLGNPGPKYDGTRHNVGFEVVDRLASRWDIDLSGERFHGWFGLGDCGHERVALMKPTTFMNRSGKAVLAAGTFYKLPFADLMVLCDDLALPVGRVRIRKSGSAGSHNGLQDIIDRIGTEDFPRMRIGIGERIGLGAQYVLSPFDADERALVDRVLDHASDAVQCWIECGLDIAMNRFNGDVPDPRV
jgi:PTH1 family peptidyl-tRNA hydrolase